MIERELPKKSIAFILLISLVLILTIGIYFKVDIQILLLIGLAFTIFLILRMGYDFEEVLVEMRKGIDRAFPALIIFLLIGTLIGSFVSGGVVPSIVYYGLKLINVKWFLPIGLIVCSMTSLATGTSWGTSGTVGVAFMAMGISLGIPAPIVAGMVVSGAFFGDKLSPLSDTTNLAAVSAGTSLYRHIKSMLYTTVPAYIISLVLYTFIGFKYSGSEAIDSNMVNTILDTLDKTFNINLFMLIPIIVVLFLSIKKVNSIIALGIGTIFGVLFSVLFQGNNLGDALNVLNTGYVGHTGVEFVDTLLNRGGIQSMMWTFSLSFIALSLGALLEGFGFLTVIIKGILVKVKSIGSLSVLVIGSCIFSNIVMGEIYLSIILNGSIYKKEFEERNLDPSMLSRYLEEGGTLTGALIPWSTAGAFVSGVLGVSALSYAPFALLNLINPLVSIVFSYLGIAVIKKENKKTI